MTGSGEIVKAPEGWWIGRNEGDRQWSLYHGNCVVADFARKAEADRVASDLNRLRALEDRLKKAADPDCDDCGGSGLYGEDCICLCVNTKHGARP